MDLTKRYYDARNSEKKVDILHMVKHEPEWAANRIQVGERALSMLSNKQRKVAESGIEDEEQEQTLFTRSEEAWLRIMSSVVSNTTGFGGECQEMIEKLFDAFERV